MSTRTDSGMQGRHTVPCRSMGGREVTAQNIATRPCRICQIPVGEHQPQALTSSFLHLVLAWFVRVPVQQGGAIMVCQPLQGQRVVDICVAFHSQCILAGRALLAELSAQSHAFGQWPGQNAGLPCGAAHLGAELHVFPVVDAQRIAMAVRMRVAGWGDWERVSSTQGSASIWTPAASQKAVPTRKSRLPGMKYTGERPVRARRQVAMSVSNRWSGVPSTSSPTHISKMSPSRKIASAGLSVR